MAALKGFRERLEWNGERGEIRDGEVRYLMIRPDTLMQLFARLDGEARRAALAAFQEATRQYGRRSAERYRSLGARPADALIATIEATAPELGWGRWRIRPAGEAWTLEVANSPFSAGYGPSAEPVCAPIAGMFAAVTALIEGHETSARETACVAQGAPACRFRAELVQTA